MRSAVNDSLAKSTSYQPVADTSYSWCVAWLLCLSYSLSHVDRQVLNLLVDPVKQSLFLTDTQFSLIQGPGFIAAYLIAAPLFGRLVDQTNRRNILIFGVCAWSVFTALCGTAESFQELLIYRCLVGISEACVFPVGWSLMPQFFSTKVVPRATSLFMIGPMLGAGVSFAAGGLILASADNLREIIPALASMSSWQIVFVVVGVPGILYALLLLAIREPARTSIHVREDTRSFTLSEAMKYIWERRGFYARVYFGIGMIGIVILGVPAWMPSFLIRHHQVPAPTVGALFGASSIALGTFGVLMGPYLARKFEEWGWREDAAMRVTVIGTIGMAVFSFLIPLWPTSDLAFVNLGVLILAYSLPNGVLAAAVQMTSPLRMRGTVASLYTFSAQSIGYGLGPSAIALVTDKVFHDPAMVGYSLQIVCTIASLIAFGLCYTALPHYRKMRAQS